MKKISATIFQFITILIGIGSFCFLILEPQIEGRNVHATLFEIYFKDSFLMCVYLASILFFMALYNAFRIFGYIKKDNNTLQLIIESLNTIKHCLLTLIILIMLAETYLFIFMRNKDDIAGGVFMGFLMIFIFSITIIVSRSYQKFLQKIK